MATPALGVNNVNFTLDPVSACVVIFPVTTPAGVNENVSSGWTVKRLRYQPSTGPNPLSPPTELQGIGSFAYGNGTVTWTLPNNCGINPVALVNDYILTLSGDAGATETLSNSGQFTFDVESGLMP